MRSLLYVSPYFPPLTRVGALRPLKFCRHLPRLGWTPHVLCDFHPGYALDATLLEALPDSVHVHRGYSRGARRCEALEMPAPGERLSGSDPRAWYPNENVVPLGAPLLDVPHATREGARLLARNPCDAILVNADPYAGLLVGVRLSRRFDLPLVVDLRDPWGPCELRRPMRPPLQRALIDRIEAWVVRRADRVILNTERVRESYTALHPDRADRMRMIRNHGDSALIGEPCPVRFDRFTAVFAGSVHRHVDGRVLLETLEVLRGLGVGPDALALAMPAHTLDALRPAAETRGVDGYLLGFPHVPYRQMGGLMREADLLISVSHPGVQRLPAKIYDYLQSERPILAFNDNPELEELLAEVPGTRTVGLDDARAGAEGLAKVFAGGRRQSLARSKIADSETATQQLVAVLDEAVGAPRD